RHADDRGRQTEVANVHDRPLEQVMQRREPRDPQSLDEIVKAAANASKNGGLIDPESGEGEKEEAENRDEEREGDEDGRGGSPTSRRLCRRVAKTAWQAVNRLRRFVHGVQHAHGWVCPVSTKGGRIS